MYCPQCGLQQISDNTRFCSRCGLAIGGLTEWLSGNAMLATPPVLPTLYPSPRRKGMKNGAKLMFLSGVLLPIFFGLALMVDEPAPLLIPFTIFLAGLFYLLYSRLFLEASPAPHQAYLPPPVRLASPAYNQALPPASASAMGNLGQNQARTSELAQPASVTEHTTRLLDND